MTTSWPIIYSQLTLDFGQDIKVKFLSKVELYVLLMVASDILSADVSL